MLTGSYDLFHFLSSILRRRASIPSLLGALKCVSYKFVRPQRSGYLIALTCFSSTLYSPRGPITTLNPSLRHLRAAIRLLSPI
jgi:hypothetical protein